jgi:hypothetical protein
MNPGCTTNATDTSTWAAPPTAVACPHLCQGEHGHPYELEDLDGSDQRHHRHQFGLDDSLTVDATHLATWRGDHEEMAPLSITM